MIRAFVGLSLPDAHRFELMLLQQGLPVRRAVAPENLHLTLCFLGEVAEPELEEVHDALNRINAPAFEMALSGLGMFGGAKPRNVHVGVAESPALRHLQAKVETAARGVGLAIDARRFVPHVTLARLNPARLDLPRLERFVAARIGFALAPFAVEDFRLYSSHLGGRGASYEELARYPLG
ncbi:MAG: RNA 2',3'-cyclic phosphodiesterase [Paracoccaceae bacterium]